MKTNHNCNQMHNQLCVILSRLCHFRNSQYEIASHYETTATGATPSTILGNGIMNVKMDHGGNAITGANTNIANCTLNAATATATNWLTPLILSPFLVNDKHNRQPSHSQLSYHFRILPCQYRHDYLLTLLSSAQCRSTALFCHWPMRWGRKREETAQEQPLSVTFVRTEQNRRSKAVLVFSNRSYGFHVLVLFCWCCNATNRKLCNLNLQYNDLAKFTQLLNQPTSQPTRSPSFTILYLTTVPVPHLH